MPTAIPVFFSIAVEGDVDEAVARRLVKEAGGNIHRIYGKRGKDHLRRSIDGYNRAARFVPWIFLVDLNHEEQCAPALRNSWLPVPEAKMCFRIAVREIETWLLADGEAFARFLRVARSRIPSNPEAVESPKRTVVELATHSRARVVREDLIPRPGSGRAIGPAYSTRLIQFAESAWRPNIAERNADSLLRCRKRLKEFVGALRGSS